MTTAAVEFDPFRDQYFDDPTEIYRRLRDDAPVYFNERYGFYALSRFDDVLAAHRDWQAFSSAHGVDLFSLSIDPDLIDSLAVMLIKRRHRSSPPVVGGGHRDLHHDRPRRAQGAGRDRADRLTWDQGESVALSNCR